MNIALAFLTYFAYAFIVVMYGKKLVTYVRQPMHLRSELHPIPHETKHPSSDRNSERLETGTPTGPRRFLKDLLPFLKEYLYFESYFKNKKTYWVVLYIFHIGSVSLIVFQILCFLCALATVYGAQVSAGSPDVAGRVFYSVILLTGVLSFAFGILGTVGVLIKRRVDQDLNLYASPMMYLGYGFDLLLFLSVFGAWYFADPTFSEYRRFWVGLVTFNPAHVTPAVAWFIIVNALHLVYLPFTYSFHYISRALAFFLIRWDDEPNVRGGALEKRVEKMLDQKLSWRGPHIRPGATWREVALESMAQGERGKANEKAH